MANRILIIESNKDDLERLKKKLNKEEYELIVAENGQKALSILEQEKPDLLILDILLPDINGFEICRRIRKNEQHVNLPLLFHTDSNTIDDKLTGLEMGAADFLNKDSDERELLIRIRNLLYAKKAIDKMIRLSVIDSLTNVYNRAYFQHRIKDEFERGKRYKRDFCCIIVGLDKFKRINERFGYVGGNRILKKAAEIIRSNIRGADILCRYGGDEFGWLLPETLLDDAYLAAERLRQFVVTSDLGSETGPVSITISCGVSSFTSNTKGSEELFEQAVEALRKAKKEGRNQTRVYEGERKS